MKKLYVHLINYEQSFKEGILTKFTREMERELKELGYTVTVSDKVNPKAQINHHINYLGGKVPNTGKHTLMITHFGEDETQKLEFLKENLKNSTGICFSRETAEFLDKKGLGKMPVILPPANLTRRPRMIAILTDLYPDGRKREGMFEELVKTIDKKKFVFSIIGNGWRPMLEEMIKSGLQVQWSPNYIQELGQQTLSIADYCLYFGKDEGAISILDATNCGVRTIAPLVGFHKEIGITHPFNTQDELNAIFKQLEYNVVGEWTWSNYCRSHIKIWEKLK
jgi:hypothetical protein